ncbi:MAG: carboxy-S-adenosyl-L-methionine synthase CmoA, partial [Gammaproteobacteria bacterium]
KIDFEQEQEASLMQELHHHMKAMNGYDAMEIANKREALEQVLLPETLDTHLQRLQETGFSQVSSWLRCLNFVSRLAIK